MGENIHNKEKVAIKIELQGGQDNQISMLKNETRILEYLSRNGIRTQIPQVYWFGTNENNFSLIMTYFVGESLETIMLRNDIKKEIIIKDWIISSINILEKIHLYGVIHRDIKPAHFIFVEEKQKWVLIDFGFSTFFSEEIEIKTKNTEYIIGTPNYISINIHNGFKPTPIDDIWSVIYIYIRCMFPELFIFSLKKNELEKEIYPLNHILNNHNQCRKERKELINK